jgi:YNFM family putative membrane transporter
MGAYVSATVAGGLSGRLLGGWIHPPLHWRYAFVSASLFLMVAAALALFRLPAEGGPNKAGLRDRPGFLALLTRWDLVRIYAVGFGAFFVFSSVFNYLPFHLAGPPFHAPTQWITFLYLSYIIGIFMGPLAGRLSDRWGNGAAMVFGAALFALAIGSSISPAVRMTP